MQHIAPILEKANSKAEAGEESAMYAFLRDLTLADYCELSLNRPQRFAALNTSFPRMPTDDVQKKWVGDSGRPLLTRSCNLARLMNMLSYQCLGSGLDDKVIVDYGCGWGRLLRIMNYFSDTNKVIGLDPMQSSIEHCMTAGIPNDIRLIDTRPTELPLEKDSVDFAFAFSVFTHTPEQVTSIVLNTLKKYMKERSVFVSTIRTIEWLRVRDGVWPAELIESVKNDYDSHGYAYVPINAGDSISTQDYGDTIMTPEYFEKIANSCGWNLSSVERDMTEPFQLAMAVMPGQ